ncbi:hypothetical protein GCM10027072_63570 [Streptomyces bullii]
MDGPAALPGRPPVTGWSCGFHPGRADDGYLSGADPIHAGARDPCRAMGSAHPAKWAPTPIDGALGTRQAGHGLTHTLRVADPVGLRGARQWR